MPSSRVLFVFVSLFALKKRKAQDQRMTPAIMTNECNFDFHCSLQRIEPLLCIHSTGRIDDIAIGTTIQPFSKDGIDTAPSNANFHVKTALEKQGQMSAANIVMEQLLHEKLPLDTSSTRISIKRLNTFEQSCVSALTDSFNDGDYDLDNFDWLECSISNVDNPPVAPRRLSTHSFLGFNMDDGACRTSQQDEPPQIPRRRSTMSQRKSVASITENRRTRMTSIRENGQNTPLTSKRWNDQPATSLKLRKSSTTLTVSVCSKDTSPPKLPCRRSTKNSSKSSPDSSHLEEDCDTDDEDAICKAFEKRYGRSQHLSMIHRRSSF